MSELPIVPDAAHGPEWSDLLQDALDGELDESSQYRLDAHLESCDTCGIELTRLRELDSRLQRQLTPMTLDASFEQRVFEEIRRREAARLANVRAAARARVEQQDRQLAFALERAWRSGRHVLFAKLGAILAAALALVVVVALPVTDLTTRYPELATLAQQPLTLIGSGLVVASVSLIFGLRHTRLA